MASTASQLESRHVTTAPADVDVSGLKRALTAAVSGEVRFDAGTRAMYANDFSIYRAVPIGVVIPKGPEDVISGVAVCREHGAPVLARGTGTAPGGQTTNVAVVFDYSKYYNQILELDPERMRARVQPGVICDQLRNAAEEYHLTYGPDPATHEYCTFGGMLGNNSCGTHSLMAGKTSDNVTSSTCCCTTARACASARPRTTNSNGSSRKAAGRARSTSSSGSSETGRRPGQAGVPRHPAPRHWLQPRRAPARVRLPRGPRPGRLRGHVRERARGDRAPGPEPPAPPHAVCSATPTCSTPPTTSQPSCKPTPSASRATTTS